MLPGLPTPATEPIQPSTQPHGIVGLRRRRLYKPDRIPARAKPWRQNMGVQLTEANLSLYEAELGVAAVADSMNLRVGRIMGYDLHANTFFVTGCRIKKRNPHKRQGDRVELDPKPIDFELAGPEVAAAVIAARTMTGLSRLTRDLSGL